MRKRCQSCGFRSECQDFFRQEGKLRLGRPQTLCEGCAPIQVQRGLYRAYVICLAVCGFALFVSFSMGVLQGAVLSTFLLACVLGRPFGVIVHEAGHALAARLVGWGVISVTIGSGRTWQAFRFGRTRVELKRDFWGEGRTVQIANTDRPGRLPQAVFVIAGPAANGALAYITLPWAMRLSEVESWPASFAAAAMFGFALVNAWMSLGNLIPFGSGPTSTASDGLHLWRLLTDWRKPTSVSPWMWRALVLNQAQEIDAAADAALRAVEAAPTDAHAISMAIHCLSRTNGHAAAIDWYLGQGGQADQLSVDPGQQMFGKWRCSTPTSPGRRSRRIGRK
jgi:hypothetical protein